VDWARPMIVGLACCVAGALVGLLLILVPFAESDIGDLPLYLLLSAPVLAGALVGGGLAARAHREPERRDPRRHLFAALSGPFVFAVFNSIGVSAELDAVWLFRLLNLALPLAAGYAGLRLLDHRAPTHRIV
jgi:hypothetical protein